MSSKYLRWKLVHKGSGLTFKQYCNQNGSDTKINAKDNSSWYVNANQYYPVIPENGCPALYYDELYYPYIIYLKPSEWEIVQK